MFSPSAFCRLEKHGYICKKKHDILLIESVIEENKAIIIDRWKDYFKEENHG